MTYKRINQLLQVANSGKVGYVDGYPVSPQTAENILTFYAKQSSKNKKYYSSLDALQLAHFVRRGLGGY